MAVVTGQSITHYQVNAKLGQGGMGEAYRATDSKLGRNQGAVAAESIVSISHKKPLRHKGRMALGMSASGKSLCLV